MGILRKKINGIANNWTPAIAKKLFNEGLKTLLIEDDDLIGKFIAEDIINEKTGEIYFGEIPPYSVVVPGSLPGKNLKNGEIGPSLYCAVIVKKVDAKTRSKTSINDLLRS